MKLSVLFSHMRAQNRDYFFNNPQKLKTRVVKKSTNPEWNEELTLSIEDPAVPVRLVCIRFHLSFLKSVVWVLLPLPFPNSTNILSKRVTKEEVLLLYC